MSQQNVTILSTIERTTQLLSSHRLYKERQDQGGYSSSKITVHH